MLKVLSGIAALAWGAAVAAYAFAGNPAVRPGLDAAGLGISVLVALGLMSGGSWVLVHGLRARRAR